MITVGDFDLTTHPPSMAPKTPALALRQLDPGSGFITSLVATTTNSSSLSHVLPLSVVSMHQLLICVGPMSIMRLTMFGKYSHYVSDARYIA